MKKLSLLAMTSMLVLSAATLAAEPPRHLQIIYDQNSHPTGDAVNSQNFTSTTFTGNNDQAADDFIVPAAWRYDVMEIKVSGSALRGAKPTSETVIFYANNRGEPGAPLLRGTYKDLVGVFNNGNITIRLPRKGMKLFSGVYWVSVIVNMDQEKYGYWNWMASGKNGQSAAMWRTNAGGQCGTWGTLGNCLGAEGPGLMFALWGTRKHV